VTAAEQNRKIAHGGSFLLERDELRANSTTLFLSGQKEAFLRTGHFKTNKKKFLPSWINAFPEPAAPQAADLELCEDPFINVPMI
jgi:hypothetical protein